MEKHPEKYNLLFKRNSIFKDIYDIVKLFDLQNYKSDPIHIVTLLICLYQIKIPQKTINNLLKSLNIGKAKFQTQYEKLVNKYDISLIGKISKVVGIPGFLYLATEIIENNGIVEYIGFIDSDTNELTRNSFKTNKIPYPIKVQTDIFSSNNALFNRFGDYASGMSLFTYRFFYYAEPQKPTKTTTPYTYIDLRNAKPIQSVNGYICGNKEYYTSNLLAMPNEINKILMSDILEKKQPILTSGKNKYYEFSLKDIAKKLYLKKPTPKNCEIVLLHLLRLSKQLFTVPLIEIMEYIDNQINKLEKKKPKFQTQYEKEKLANFYENKGTIMQLMETDKNPIKRFIDIQGIDKGINITTDSNGKDKIDIIGTQISKVKLNISLPMDIWELSGQQVKYNSDMLREKAVNSHTSELDYKVNEIIITRTFNKTKPYKKVFNDFINDIPKHLLSKRFLENKQQLKQQVEKIIKTDHPEISINKSKKSNDFILLFKPQNTSKEITYQQARPV